MVAPETTRPAEVAPSAAGDDAAARGLGRNITALATGQFITWSMTLLWTLVVPRALGPAGMGLIVSAWAVSGVLGVVLGMGTRTYLVRELVANDRDRPALIGTAIALRVLLSPLFFAAVLIYSEVAGYGREGNIVLYLAAGATVLTLIAEPFQAGFQAVERMEFLAYSDVINKLAQGLLGVVLAVIGFRSIGITACWLVVSGIVVILDVIWLRPLVPLDLRVTTRRIRSMVRHSTAYWAFGLFFMLYLWIDSVMLSLMTNEEVVGWYGVPTKLFQTMMFVPVIISTAWLPRLVQTFEKTPDELARAARAPVELVLAISFPICAAIAVTASPLIHVLYGSAYDNAVPVLILLGFCIPPMYLNIMLNQVLVAKKRQVQWTWVMAVATVINPLINAVLIHVTQRRYDNGAIGAAISLILTELVVVGIGVALVGRSLIPRDALRRLALVAAASAGVWGISAATRPLGTIASLGAAAVAFIVFATTLPVVTREERAVVYGLGRRFAGRVPGLGRRFGVTATAPAAADG